MTDIDTLLANIDSVTADNTAAEQSSVPDGEALVVAARETALLKLRKLTSTPATVLIHIEDYELVTPEAILSASKRLNMVRETLGELGCSASSVWRQGTPSRYCEDRRMRTFFRSLGIGVIGQTEFLAMEKRMMDMALTDSGERRIGTEVQFLGFNTAAQAEDFDTINIPSQTVTIFRDYVASR